MFHIDLLNIPKVRIFSFLFKYSIQPSYIHAMFHIDLLNIPKVCIFSFLFKYSIQPSYIPSGIESTCEVSVISLSFVARSKSSSSSWVAMTVVLQSEEMVSLDEILIASYVVPQTVPKGRRNTSTA